MKHPFNIPLLFLILIVCLTGIPFVADDTDKDQIRRILERLETLEQENKALKAELEALMQSMDKFNLAALDQTRGIWPRKKTLPLAT